MNYIVKNCPDYEGEGAFYNCVNEHTEGDCQDCTDCVIKQIVEKCRERYVGFLEESFIKDEILNLLQIEVIK